MPTEPASVSEHSTNQTPQEPAVSEHVVEASSEVLADTRPASTVIKKSWRDMGYDSDGLQAVNDEVQCQIQAIMSEHHKEMQLIRKELAEKVEALTKLQKKMFENCSSIQQDGKDIGIDNALIAPGCHNGACEDSEESSSAVHTASSATSDTSWEAFDENEAKQTLWVPDHVYSSCMRYVYSSGCEKCRRYRHT